MSFAELATKVRDIVECVNGGQCAEYSKAEFIVSYPAALYLFSRDGSQVAIYALDAITDTGTGYRIDYTVTDRRTAKQTHKAVFVTFQ